MNDKNQDYEGLDWEDILKEFGEEQESLTPAEETAEHSLENLKEMLRVIPDEAQQPETEDALAGADPEEAGLPADEAPEELQQELVQWEEPEEADDVRVYGAPEPAEGPETEEAVSLDETVRLDDLSQMEPAETIIGGMDDRTERIGSIWEELPDQSEQPVLAQTAPKILQHPRAKLRELKRKLVAGPEKRYYELTEIGTGKLQIAILLCVLVVILAAVAGGLYAAGMVPESRMRLMIFSQVLAMLFGGLMGSQQLIAGVSDLFRGRFTTNTLLVVTFLAACADSLLCLKDLRVPLCAAFTLEVAMALWNTYQRRTVEMGQMDTMRKAVRLDSLVGCDDYLDGRSAFLRGEGQVEDFMDHYQTVPGPEKAQNVYALLSMLVSLGIGILAAVLHDKSLGVQIFSTTLLVAFPASFFISVTRPLAVLERKLHRMGTVICGWQGIRGLCGKGMFPLRDTDMFPDGSTKMNGVKFYSERDPELVIAYAAALIRVNGGSLVPAFEQLLASHNGVRYEAKNVQYYAGGVGGELCGEPALLGTLEFLKEMGVDIPSGMMVKQAVYLSIDGELCGLFAVNYARMKYAAVGLGALCGNRKLNPVILTEDFMVTGPFLKEKFGVSPRRMVFPTRQDRVQLAGKQPAEDAQVLALTTQEGLAPAALAINGARAARTACRLGLVVHIVGGVLGMLIMAALAVLGSAHLLTPIHILLYQLIWMVPGVLATFWPKTI